MHRKNEQENRSYSNNKQWCSYQTWSCFNLKTPHESKSSQSRSMITNFQIILEHQTLRFRSYSTDWKVQNLTNPSPLVQQKLHNQTMRNHRNQTRGSWWDRRPPRRLPFRRPWWPGKDGESPANAELAGGDPSSAAYGARRLGFTGFDLWLERTFIPSLSLWPFHFFQKKKNHIFVVY